MDTQAYKAAAHGVDVRQNASATLKVALAGQRTEKALDPRLTA
ncbi:hypothetical protein [Variovorax sp. HJSM1_2]